MAHYLVTGGAGFIGSNLVDALLARSEEVSVLDNYSTGLPANLAAAQDNSNIVVGDICNLSLVQKCAQGVDFILHQAALPSVPRSINDPMSTNRNNVEGTLNVLWAARQAGVKRVVIASSSSVYGDTEVLPKCESMPPNPRSPYALSKFTGEQYALIFQQLYGIEVVVLRYFNVFGPRQNPESQYAAAIPRFILWGLKGARVPIFGDGEQSRDFTFIANVVHANLLACSAADASGKVFNVSTGTRFTLNQTIALLSKLIGREIACDYLPPREGDVRHSQGDISLAQQFLGYQPVTEFEDGLAQTVDYFRGKL